MRSGYIPDNWKDLVAVRNKILQDSTDDVAFKWAAQSVQLEIEFHQSTDPLLNPQIITESVPVNKSAKTILIQINSNRSTICQNLFLG